MRDRTLPPLDDPAGIGENLARRLPAWKVEWQPEYQRFHLSLQDDVYVTADFLQMRGVADACLTVAEHLRRAMPK